MGAELDLFKEIWLEREHKCSVCGEPLPIFYHGYMSHCISKGSRPDLKLLKENIDILCLDDHRLWENSKWYIKPMGKWKWLFNKYERLKKM